MRTSADTKVTLVVQISPQPRQKHEKRNFYVAENLVCSNLVVISVELCKNVKTFLSVNFAHYVRLSGREKASLEDL